MLETKLNEAMELFNKLPFKLKFDLQYCFECNNIVSITDVDTCISCGYEYNVTQEDYKEICPECDYPYLYNHCDNCNGLIHADYLGDLLFSDGEFFEEYQIEIIINWCKGQ